MSNNRISNESSGYNYESNNNNNKRTIIKVVAIIVFILLGALIWYFMQKDYSWKEKDEHSLVTKEQVLPRE